MAVKRVKHGNNIRNLNEMLKDGSVKVGVFGVDAYKALAQEIGANPGRVERPFITDEFFSNIGFIRQFIEDGLSKKTPIQNIMKDLGVELKNKMINRVIHSSKYYQENAKTTIAKKGFNHPLIDTGDMLNSIDYKVGDK